MNIQSNPLHALLWAVLPKELEEHFEITGHEKTDTHFRIFLTEKNIPPNTEGKLIINTLLKTLTVDDYPLRGRKCELIIQRRYWKLADTAKLLKRDIPITKEGTKLACEFANFLKEQN
jgi:hypothetical protein